MQLFLHFEIAKCFAKTISMKKFLDNKGIKALFSISIIGSAIPSIYQDFAYGSSGQWTHYGMILVGILYLIEAVLWTLDLWKKE